MIWVSGVVEWTITRNKFLEEQSSLTNIDGTPPPSVPRPLVGPQIDSRRARAYYCLGETCPLGGLVRVRPEGFLSTRINDHGHDVKMRTFQLRPERARCIIGKFGRPRLLWSSPRLAYTCAIRSIGLAKMMMMTTIEADGERHFSSRVARVASSSSSSGASSASSPLKRIHRSGREFGGVAFASRPGFVLANAEQQAVEVRLFVFVFFPFLWCLRLRRRQRQRRRRRDKTAGATTMPTTRVFAGTQAHWRIQRDAHALRQADERTFGQKFARPTCSVQQACHMLACAQSVNLRPPPLPPSSHKPANFCRNTNTHTQSAKTTIRCDNQIRQTSTKRNYHLPKLNKSYLIILQHTH